MKTILKRLLRSFGFELRRLPATDLPVLHDCVCDGHRFPFWIANEHAAAWWMAHPVRFDAEMRFLERVAQPGSVVLEVGAHHGMYTVQLARWVGPSGLVHAFEMNADNALVLAANVGVSRSTNVHVHHAAVAAQEGIVTGDGEQVAGGGRAVRAVALDGFCRTAGLDRVDILKIDVEGFEGYVLRGAREILRARPHLDLELHCDELAKFGDTVESVVDLIGLDGYTLTYMHRPNWDDALPASTVGAIPRQGVVNLFFTSAARPVAAAAAVPDAGRGPSP